ncbi:MAG TPA: ribonuclease domain-containing protein [Candidatus Limnocylindria bacterium]|nr:ribonuclease domain-containing protein [Candidatus Limnocylindria bacterium]
MRRTFALLVGALLLLSAPLAVSARDSTKTRIPAVSVADLPQEARATLALIKQGGPFPHRRDGVVFNNFERRLPIKERGYYREYTVPTPGARDRGARRIVAGGTSEYYYTADHYRSFRRIRE